MTGRGETGAPDSAVAWAVIDRHDSGGTCGSCRPEECETLGWARRVLAEHRAARAALLDGPVW
ncbi:hypothetical protein QTQ03_18130 [Micromonospora sp. WMMA1363]|uniref:hypothetical protein n=1 Tax=Micromonospora sp. WMMA1363 TaxID=3053985 RepID=UPI00259CE30B|nr:hypothetical protein [Micromonospora sp. WMMA1363]MDM4721424.1 hypothetical protein [Micromonospora sp. WMMA1363]